MEACLLFYFSGGRTLPLAMVEVHLEHPDLLVGPIGDESILSQRLRCLIKRRGIGRRINIGMEPPIKE
jgi:hypothetical protein